MQKAICLVNTPITDSGFVAVNLPNLIKGIILDQINRLQVTPPELKKVAINKIAREINNADKRGCKRVILSAFMDKEDTKELAIALLDYEIDVYIMGIGSKDVTYFDYAAAGVIGRE